MFANYFQRIQPGKIIPATILSPIPTKHTHTHTHTQKKQANVAKDKQLTDLEERIGIFLVLFFQ